MVDDADPPDPAADAVLLARAIVSEQKSPEVRQKDKDASVDVGAEIIKVVFFMLSTIAAKAVGPVVEGILSGEQAAEGSYQKIAAAALSAMFDVEINTGDVGAFGRGGNSGAAQKIGAAVFKAFGDPHGSVEPGDANANAYVARMVNLEVEGWLNGLIFECLMEAGTAGWVKPEEFAKLKDGLVKALGLSRLSRRVLGPYVNAVCVQPFTWQVNKTYRPTLLSPAQAARQLLRGKKTSDRYFEETARAGYADDDAESILNAAKQKLSIDDWLYLERYAGVADDVVTNALHDLGCDDATIDALRTREHAKVVQAQYEKNAAAAIDGYLNGSYGYDAMVFVLTSAYKDPQQRQAILDGIDLKRLTSQKRLTESEVKEAVTRNILSTIDYRDWLEQENYSPDAAMVKELLLQSTLSDKSAADLARQQKQAEKDAAAAAKKAADDERRRKLEAAPAGPLAPIGDFRRAVVLGLIPVDRYQAELVARKYSADDVAFMVSLAQRDRDDQLVKEDDAKAAATRAAAKGLSTDALTKAVVGNLISQDDMRARLVQSGLAAADVDVVMGLVQQKVDAAAIATSTHATAAAALGQHGLSLAQLEKAVTVGVRTMAWFRQALVDGGVVDPALAVLVDTLQAVVDQRAAAEALHTQVADALASKGLSLADLEKAVIAGLRDIAEVDALLTRQGYGVADRQTLLQLLQSKADDAAAARKKRDQVATATAGGTTTIAQLERGVKLGTVTLDAYDAWLTSKGYDDADRELLHDNLVLELQVFRAGDVGHAQLLAELGPAAAAIAQLEHDVVAGVAPIGAYQQALAGAGAAPDDVAAAVTWLQVRVDDATDANRSAGIVDAALKTKNLSLAQWYDAMKAGLRTLDDYGAFLIDDGYDQADAEILVALASAKLDKAAAAAA